MSGVVLVSAALWIGGLAGVRADGPAAEVVAGDLGFPEGTIFVGGDLYFVDYVSSSVLRLVDGKAELVWQQPGCGANGLVTVAGGLLVACFDSNRVVKISTAGATLGTIRQDSLGHALEAPNDFAADRKGGIYLTASGSSDTLGKVFYWGTNGVVREVASGTRFANGVGVSPDGATLYVAETPTGKILAFSINGDGSLSEARDFIRLRDVLGAQGGGAKPDSLRVDSHGNVFVALYDGGGVAVVSPGGVLLRQIGVPSAHHTNLAISPDQRSLYVTAVDDGPGSTYHGQIVRMANPLAP